MFSIYKYLLYYENRGQKILLFFNLNMLFQLTVKTNKREEIIDITHQVNEYVKKSSAKNGLCIVYTPHTTTAITTNENYDPNVKTDILRFLNSSVPVNWGFSHDEGNSDAHIKSSLLGARETYIINDGSLTLGTWQGILFCEFDGPRTRKVLIKFIGEDTL